MMKSQVMNFGLCIAYILAMCIFSTVFWTLKVVPKDMDNMLNKIRVILEDHEYFTNVKPRWYN